MGNPTDVTNAPRSTARTAKENVLRQGVNSSESNPFGSGRLAGVIIAVLFVLLLLVVVARSLARRSLGSSTRTKILGEKNLSASKAMPETQPSPSVNDSWQSAPEIVNLEPYNPEGKAMHLSIDRSNTPGRESVTYRFTLKLLATPEELALLDRYAKPADTKGLLKQYLAGLSFENTALGHTVEMLEIHMNNVRSFVALSRNGEAFAGHEEIDL
jgi:hypothetical protein